MAKQPPARLQWSGDATCPELLPAEVQAVIAVAAEIALGGFRRAAADVRADAASASPDPAPESAGPSGGSPGGSQ